MFQTLDCQPNGIDVSVSDDERQTSLLHSEAQAASLKYLDVFRTVQSPNIVGKALMMGKQDRLKAVQSSVLPGVCRCSVTKLKT